MKSIWQCFHCLLNLDIFCNCDFMQLVESYFLYSYNSISVRRCLKNVTLLNLECFVILQLNGVIFVFALF